VDTPEDHEKVDSIMKTDMLFSKYSKE
jgi:hypothetical protein